MNNNDNGTVNDKNSKTARRTFSISKEFSHLLSEIDNLPNSSRFICEAIVEKLERQRNPGKEIADALANFVQLQAFFGNQQAPATTQNTLHTPQVEAYVVPPAESRGILSNSDKVSNSTPTEVETESITNENLEQAEEPKKEQNHTNANLSNEPSSHVSNETIEKNPINKEESSTKQAETSTVINQSPATIVADETTEEERKAMLLALGIEDI